MNDHDLTVETWCDNEELSSSTDVKLCGPIPIVCGLLYRVKLAEVSRVIFRVK